MGRAAHIVGALVLALAGAGQAMAATAAATARVTIIEGNAVRINWTMAMPSVRAGGGGAAFVGAAPSMTMGLRTPAGARLAVRATDPTGAQLTAPASFEVVSLGGEDAVMVRTATGTETAIARDRVIVGGSLPGASAASIGGARGLGPVSAAGQALMVVVQYN